ncbi:glycosyltransferase involved in cell wall biosynthesis [Paraburkholderia sp. GAS199]|uniref:glycosyltransferase n=1 Tax=Paraburkholderia sp. GAS199 TaxID=3035126 RepID=UPI003D1A2534
MKIAILAHLKHPIAQPFAGGLEAFTYEITHRLAARDNDVRLFALAGTDGRLPVEPITIRFPTRTNSPRQMHDQLSAEYIAEHHAYMNCMQAIDNLQFDVIFNNSLHYVPITMGGMIRTPMLTVIHTPPFFELINATTAQHERGGGHYCSVSRFNAHAWREQVPECSIIPNGIALDVWTPTDTPDRSYAIWSGRFVPEKGAHHAIDAAIRAGVPLRLAGLVTDEGYFNDQIKPRLNAQVQYLGHLSRDELARHVRHAAVSVVTPCWDEPFGLVVAESLACGTPVAAFARGAIKELASPETVALAEPDNVDALADAIRIAMSMSRWECRVRAEMLWDIENMVTQYEALLERISCSRAETFAGNLNA